MSHSIYPESLNPLFQIDGNDTPPKIDGDNTAPFLGRVGDLWVRKGIGYKPEQRTDIAFSEPAEAVEALLLVEQFAGEVWDPSAGVGTIARVFGVHLGKGIKSTDLYDHGNLEVGSGVDFLLQNGPTVDCIVCNPPFSLVIPFVRKAGELARQKVAFFGPIRWLESKSRYEQLWQPFGLSRLWIFPYRLRVATNKTPAGRGGGVLYGWFVWEIGGPPVPELRWFPFRSRPYPGGNSK